MADPLTTVPQELLILLVLVFVLVLIAAVLWLLTRNRKGSEPASRQEVGFAEAVDDAPVRKRVRKGFFMRRQVDGRSEGPSVGIQSAGATTIGTRIKVKQKSFQQMICSEDNALLESLFNVLSQEELSTISFEMAMIFYRENSFDYFVRWMIRRELDRDPDALLNTMCSGFHDSVLSSFALLIGQEYASDALSTAFRQLSEQQAQLPDHPNTESELIAANMKFIKDFTSLFLTSIAKTQEYAPGPLREVCVTIRSIVRPVYPRIWRQVVGQFVFVQLFTNVLERPDIFKMMSAPPTPSFKAVLQSLSLMISCLVHETQFDGPLEALNPFLDQQFIVYKTFIDNLATKSGKGPPPMRDVTDDELKIATTTVYVLLNKHRKKLLAKLESVQPRGSQYHKQLSVLLDDLRVTSDQVPPPPLGPPPRQPPPKLKGARHRRRIATDGSGTDASDQETRGRGRSKHKHSGGKRRPSSHRRGASGGSGARHRHKDRSRTASAALTPQKLSPPAPQEKPLPPEPPTEPYGVAPDTASAVAGASVMVRRPKSLGADQTDLFYGHDPEEEAAKTGEES